MGVTERVSDHTPPARPAADQSDTLRIIGAGHSPRAEVYAVPLGRHVRARLFVRRLRIDAQIGVHTHEKGRTQGVMVDLEFGLPDEMAFHTDRIGDAVDYVDVVARLRALAVERHYDLVESLAETMAAILQREFGVPWLQLSLAKVAPFPGAEVGVVIERGQRA